MQNRISSKGLSLFVLAGVTLAKALVPGMAAGQESGARAPVDTALVLAVDASGSIDPTEFALQREGIAAAVTSADLLDVVSYGQHGTIAIAYLEWGGPGTAEVMVPWMLVNDEKSASGFAAAVLAAPRSLQSYNAIGDAITSGQALFEACPCLPSRRIIDVSGDNPDIRSIVSAPVARDRAVGAGIVINALAILQDGMLGPRGKPWLVEAYEAEVIGGPGAFVMTAQNRRDFERALLDKMLLEISGGEPIPSPPLQIAEDGVGRPRLQ